ncbi:hypothetical protein VTO42DRAFT_1122 [Malbranchea cinnamomea]
MEPNRLQSKTSCRERRTTRDVANRSLRRKHLIILCLLEKNSVQETLRIVPAASFAGKIIVNTTNGTPDQWRETLQFVKSHAGNDSTVKYIQGAILAIPPMIGQPGSLLLYFGDKVVFDAVESALRVLGQPGTSTPTSAPPRWSTCPCLAV